MIADLDIFQINEHVFQIGQVDNIEKSFFNLIINILNKGTKFVPVINISSFDLFKYFIHQFERELICLNKKIFIKNIAEPPRDQVASQFIDPLLIPAQNNSPYDLFFDKSRNSMYNNKIHSFFNYRFQEESLNFKFEIYEKLSTHFVNFKNNLSPKEITALYSFVNYKQFKVTETDKNIGITVSTHQVYNDLALKHLQDTNIYSKIDNLNIFEINTLIKNSIDYLLTEKHITKKLSNAIIIDNNSVKFGKFRLMPKLHKSKFGIRPIINCSSHPT